MTQPFSTSTPTGLNFIADVALMLEDDIYALVNRVRDVNSIEQRAGPSLLQSLRYPDAVASTDDVHNAYADSAETFSPTNRPYNLFTRSCSSDSLVPSTPPISPVVATTVGDHRGKAAKSAKVIAATRLSSRSSWHRKAKEQVVFTRRIGSKPVTPHQKMIQQMVFDQITAYPDKIWIESLGSIIGRTPEQVQNWFSNHRSPPNEKKGATGKKLDCGEHVDYIYNGRKLQLRPAALEHCRPEEWFGSLFEEVVKVHSFRMLVRRTWRNSVQNVEACGDVN